LLATYLRPQRRRVALLAALLFTGIALQIGNPLLVRAFIDSATTGGDARSLTALALAFLGVAVVAQAAAVAETYVAESVGWAATNALRTDLALHCLRLDMAFHNARTPGELIERIDGDVTTLANFFSRFILNIVGNVLLMVGALALLWHIDWRVGLCLSLFVAGALVVMLRIRSIAVPWWLEARQASAGFFGFLGEALSGLEDVKANGAAGYVLRRAVVLMRGWLRVDRRANLASYGTGVSSLLLFAIGTALAFALGASLYTAHAISIGTVYLIFQYTELLRRPTEQIRSQLQDLQQAGAGIERVRALFATEPAIREPGHPTPLPATAPAVEFAGVTFGYDAEAPVLREISFRLAPGEVLGVLGRTGSGKTSLTRLLLRQYDPQVGAVRLGGVELRAASLAELRARVGVVTQDVRLFHASVRDNLTFFDAGMPDARVTAALEEVGLGAWLAGLPAGLDTVLAGGGGGLSAGEAQLLAFARVLLRDPQLVILDEASSRLDAATEARLWQATERLLAGRTGLIIAHRLATVAHADHILVLEDGRVREYGPRTALANDPESRFAELLRVGEVVTSV
jgi:ATP-binding cassette, subfamily B, bacterial